MTASPVMADGKLYVATNDGAVSVLEAGREFKLLAKNQIDDQIFSSLAVAGGQIFIRGWRNLYRIGDA